FSRDWSSDVCSSDLWLRYFLTQDPDFAWTTITHARYERLFEQSAEQFGLVIGTDNPDLRAFRDRGGKVVVWHGWSDQLISAAGRSEERRAGNGASVG